MNDDDNNTHDDITYDDSHILARLNPPTTIIEPRPRASSRLPLKWYALYDAQGHVFQYVHRRSESEARETLSMNAMVMYDGGGKVKLVKKPPLGWINGQLVRAKEKERAAKKWRMTLEELL